MSKDILDFSAVQVWVTSCYAVKLQFLDVEDFMEEVDQLDNETDKIIIKSSLLKRVLDWHNEICGVLTRKYVKEHTPEFVREIFNNAKLQVPNDSGASSDILCDPLDLHVSLLVKASEMMISCFVEVDLSKDAVNAMKNWFDLFDQPDFDAFLQCSEKYVEWQTKIQSLQFSFQCSSESDNVGNGNLGHFFDPGTLFIYLAHAVFMECYDPSFTCIPSGSRRVQTDGLNRLKYIEEWQHHCGSLVKVRFESDLFKGMTRHDPMEFPILGELNTVRAQMDEKKYGTDKTPPVHVLHYHLLDRMFNVSINLVEEGDFCINQKEEHELNVLECMCSKLRKKVTIQMKKLDLREKTFRSDLKRGKQKGFRIDRAFNNDIFLMEKDVFANFIKVRRKENWDEMKNPF